VLDSFGLTRSDAENMIMTARIKVGWITEEEAAAEQEADAADAEAEA
jgi:N utilization substance protein A